MFLARGIAAGMTLAVLAAAGPAVGGGTEPTVYAGPFEAGGKISFRLAHSNDPRVDQIKIEGITAQCRGGSGSLDFEIYGSTPVLADRSFAVRSEDGTGGRAVVKGRFSRQFKRAVGTARVFGRFRFPGAGSTRCNSEKQSFVAR